MTREEILQTFSDINHAYNNSTKYDTLKRMIDELTEPCEDNQREFIELVVEYINPDLCTYPEYRGKPYFSIKYRENGKEYIGFGTYKIEFLSQWIKEYFMPNIQPKTDVLDKIRAEIKEESRFCPLTEGLERALEIIDKHTAESEDT
jgi:hypothetical protein